MNNNKGFSLIELMIVVAIIGILSAVAIPNFQRFQLKARQSEAKNQLAAIYSAQKAFHQEWSQYFDDFRDIGFAPEGTLGYHLAIGDGAMTAPVAAAGYTYTGGAGAGNDGTNQNDSSEFCAAAGTCVENTSFVTPAASADIRGRLATTTTVAFTAGAGADLRRNAGAEDTWIINQAKQLTNPTTDL